MWRAPSESPLALKRDAPLGKRPLTPVLAPLLVSLLAARGTAAQGLPDANALFARGVGLQQAGDLVGAIEAYQVALEKEPDRIDARSNLGAAYAQLGRYDQAIEHYRAVLARVPDQARVRFNLALALYKSARIVEAAAELERVVPEPGNPGAVLLLADCRAQMGDDAGVVSLLGPREEEFKNDRLYAYLLGNALIRSNELLRGQAYIERLFQGGETAEARLLMGVAHLRRGDAQAALPELERAAQLKPELPTVHSLLGRSLMRMARRDEALAAFRRELARNPNDFDANVYVGLFLKEDSKLDEAAEYLKRARRLRPEDPAALYALGALHLATGQVDEAQKSLEAAVARVPAYLQAHVLLATVYYRQKKTELGDRQRLLADKLRAEQQAKEPGAADDLGPAYRGHEPAPTAKAPGRR
jgi:tetratricopeptide (TPR) repeat protein